MDLPAREEEKSGTFRRRIHKKSIFPDQGKMPKRRRIGAWMPAPPLRAVHLPIPRRLPVT
jgi:hypothetical protein